MLVVDPRQVSVLDFEQYHPDPVRVSDWVEMKTTRVVAARNNHYSLPRILSERHAHESLSTSFFIAFPP